MVDSLCEIARETLGDNGKSCGGSLSTDSADKAETPECSPVFADYLVDFEPISVSGNVSFIDPETSREPAFMDIPEQLRLPERSDCRWAFGERPFAAYYLTIEMIRDQNGCKSSSSVGQYGEWFLGDLLTLTNAITFSYFDDLRPEYSDSLWKVTGCSDLVTSERILVYPFHRAVSNEYVKDKIFFSMPVIEFPDDNFGFSYTLTFEPFVDIPILTLGDELTTTQTTNPFTGEKKFDYRYFILDLRTEGGDASQSMDEFLLRVIEPGSQISGLSMTQIPFTWPENPTNGTSLKINREDFEDKISLLDGKSLIVFSVGGQHNDLAKKSPKWQLIAKGN